MKLPEYQPSAVQRLVSKPLPSGDSTRAGMQLIQLGAEWVKAESKLDANRASVQAINRAERYTSRLINEPFIPTTEVEAAGVAIPEDLKGRDQVPTYRVMNELYAKEMERIATDVGGSLQWDQSKSAFNANFAKYVTDTAAKVEKQHYDWRYAHIRGVGQATLDGMLETVGPENRDQVILNGQGVINDMIEQGAVDLDKGIEQAQTWAGDVDFAVGMNSVYTQNETLIEAEMDRVATRDTSMTAKQQGQFMRAADAALRRITDREEDAKAEAQDRNAIKMFYDILENDGGVSNGAIAELGMNGAISKEAAVAGLRYNRTVRESAEAEDRKVVTDPDTLARLDHLVSEFRYGQSEVPAEQRQLEIYNEIQRAMGYNELGMKSDEQLLTTNDYNALLNRLNNAAEAPQRSDGYKATVNSIRRLVAGVEGGVLTSALGDVEKLRLDRALGALDAYMENTPNPDPQAWWRSAQDYYLDQETKEELAILGNDIAAGAIVLVDGKKAAFSGGEIEPGQARVDITQSAVNLQEALRNMLIDADSFDAGMRALQAIDEKQRALR